MKVSIDRDDCIECGVCESVCPEVFEIKDNEKANIVKEFQSGGPDKGEITESLASCVREAAESCPEEIIHIG